MTDLDRAWTCALCGWTSEHSSSINTSVFNSYVCRAARCEWSAGTLRNMRTCIWCYDRMGFATHEEFAR